MITIITSIIAMVLIKRKNSKGAFKALLTGLIIDLVIFIGGILTSFIIIVSYSGISSNTDQPAQEQIPQCQTQAYYNSNTQKFETIYPSEECYE